MTKATQEERVEIEVLVKLTKKQRYQLFQKDELTWAGKLYLIPESQRIPHHKENNSIPGETT